ncbi:hypothetical protein RSJ21_18385 [Clostridium botulinum]|nr:hypothetical protein RSJ15_17800 [Clostridium botulinum]KEI74160.1 hypothetical protein N486_17240 [Clostridium botulinum B2 128]KEI74561.1 hypothetical protein N487_17160 [Clostridium botulinum B2 331]KEI85237.1 hypothetical protein N493_17285 [Clostridium botulinum B2 433]AUN12420.1 hypothetical protein RSJ6_18720 [Clostridium botulinum]
MYFLKLIKKLNTLYIIKNQKDLAQNSNCVLNPILFICKIYLYLSQIEILFKKNEEKPYYFCL